MKEIIIVLALGAALALSIRAKIYSVLANKKKVRILRAIRDFQLDSPNWKLTDDGVFLALRDIALAASFKDVEDYWNNHVPTRVHGWTESAFQAEVRSLYDRMQSEWGCDPAMQIALETMLHLSKEVH